MDITTSEIEPVSFDSHIYTVDGNERQLSVTHRVNKLFLMRV